LRAAFPSLRVAQPRQPDGSQPRVYTGISLNPDTLDTRFSALFHQPKEKAKGGKGKNNGVKRVSGVSTKRSKYRG
jgi:hypothetical protein